MAEIQSNLNEAGSLAVAVTEDERAERITQLESEIEMRRAEISRLQIDTTMNYQDQARYDAEEDQDEWNVRDENKSGSLHTSLRELITLWEHRLTEDKGGLMKSTPSVAKPSIVSSATFTDFDAPPDIVYTTSMESDATSVASTDTDITTSSLSLRQNHALKHLDSVVSSHGRNAESAAHTQVLKSMIEERDIKIKSLEAAMSTDTLLIEKMKDTIKELVEDRKEAESISSIEIAELKQGLRALKSVQETSLEPNDSDLPGAGIRLAASTPEPVMKMANSNTSLQDKQKNAPKANSARLQSAIAGLEAQCSDQENVIEFLKTEMVKLLVNKRMKENELSTEIQRRDETIHKIQRTSNDKSDHSQRIIAVLGASTSCLEDQIEKLKVESVRSRIRSEMLKEEKGMLDEEMKALKTDLQLHYIDNSCYEIL